MKFEGGCRTPTPFPPPHLTGYPALTASGGGVQPAPPRPLPRPGLPALRRCPAPRAGVRLPPPPLRGLPRPALPGQGDHAPYSTADPPPTLLLQGVEPARHGGTVPHGEEQGLCLHLSIFGVFFHPNFRKIVCHFTETLLLHQNSQTTQTCGFHF